MFHLGPSFLYFNNKVLGSNLKTRNTKKRTDNSSRLQCSEVRKVGHHVAAWSQSLTSLRCLHYGPTVLSHLARSGPVSVGVSEKDILLVSPNLPL